MNRDRWLFQISRFGWPGALGAVLLLAALAGDRLVNLPLEDELANHQALAARKALLPVAAERVHKPVAAPAARVETALPRLFSAARHHDLVLEQGRYAQTGKSGDRRRLQIDLPLVGSYPALRAFLAEVLENDPALVLEHLELTREDIATTQLEAHLRFALNLETQP